MTVLAILQARMTSSRLPGKVLMDIDGMPMIGRQLQRLREAKLLDDIIVATSTEASDDPLAKYVESMGVKVQRGSLNDVLQRFVDVLDSNDCQSVVRLTADCPLTDADVIDGAVELFNNLNVDYVSNSLERTFPRGLDVEVFRPEVLRDVARFDFRAMSREHVTYGIYTRTDLFSTASYTQNPSFAEFRWTVDTQRDLDFVRTVYRHFLPMKQKFKQREVLDWLSDHPEFAHFDSENK